jgi:ribosome biogenesis protein SSF1/2
VQVAGQLGVTHTLVLAQKGANVNLRIGRLPRGPTMTFRVTEFAVCKQVLAMQRRPRFPEADFKTSPLVVLNSFSGNQNHIKLMSVMFQNMFPTINVQKLKFNEARRVVLFNYNQEKEQIEMRHYSVAIRQTGVSKGIRNVLQAKLKNIEKYDDLGDFILTYVFESGLMY